MRTVAVIVAGAARFDVLAPVAGAPLLVTAVRGLVAAGVCTSVHVVLRGVAAERVVDACTGLPVELHPELDPAGALFGVLAGRSDALVVHDAARAFAPPALFEAVLAGVRAGYDAVVPVVALTDTVKEVDGAGRVGATPDRSALRVVQTPQAYRSSVVAALVAEHPDVDPLRMAAALAAAGVEVHTVAGDPAAFAVRSPWDARLAQVWRQGGAAQA